MFLKAAALFLLSSIVVDADNTPNLCSSDILNLQRIAPSTTGLDINPIPEIKVGSGVYSGDAEHFVMIPNGHMVDQVMVYLPGTTDRPELSSCLLQSVSETLDYPTIGLSYAYLSSGDGFRNGKCALLSLEEQINCLDAQHKDAIDGGDYGATHFKADGSAFWKPIAPANSITARLVKLLKYLNEQNPGMGWSSLYTGDEPRWEKIIVMGHSQGAGHAAYLGQTKSLLGAVMISGPQDECVNCPEGTTFWIDDAYKTKNKYTAFASGDEPMYAVQAENWSRMTEAGATKWKDPTDVNFAIGDVSACDSPLFTNVKYGAASTCGGKEHCSTAIDDSVPILEKSNGDKCYLYGVKVWPSLVTGVSTCKSSKGAKDSKSATKMTKAPKAAKGGGPKTPKGL